MSITAILIVLIVPCLYAVANLVDSFQLNGGEDDSTPGALMALGSIFGFLFIIPLGLWIYFTGRSLGGLETIIPLLFVEILYIVAMYIYMTAMKSDEASLVIPWFQIIPVFGLIGAFLILGEAISTLNLVSIGLLVLGGIILSYRKGRMNKKLIIMMVSCAGLLALYDVLFAYFGRDIDPYSAIFINLVGKVVWSSLFLIGKQERNGFTIGLKTRLKVQAIGEITTAIADIALCICLLHFPVALVQGIECTQPIMVLIGAVILTKYRPDVIVEDVEGLTLFQKIVGIALMVVAGIILSV